MSPLIISPGVESEGLRVTSNLNAIRFQMLRDYLCFSFSLIEALNSKRVSFLDLEGQGLKGILQMSHGLSGKECGAWKNCHSLLIPFVFKEKDGFSHGNAKEP